MNEKQAKALRRFVNAYCKRTNRTENQVQEVPVGRPREIWIESPVEHQLVRAVVQGSMIVNTAGPRFIYQRLKALLKQHPTLDLASIEGALPA